MADRPQPRLRQGEFATAAWALALLVSMLALKWYGVDNIPGRAGSVVVAVDAWNGLGVLRWLMLATIAFAIASVGLHLSQRDHGTQSDTSLPLAIAATFVAVGLVYRVLIALPSPNAVVDQKLGALIGLGCSLAMALSAWQARRAAVAAAKAPPVRRHRRAAPAAPGAERLASSAPGGPGGIPSEASTPEAVAASPGLATAAPGVATDAGPVEPPAILAPPTGARVVAPARARVVAPATPATPPGRPAAPHATRVVAPAARTAPPATPAMAPAARTAPRAARVPGAEAAHARTPRPASP